MTTDLFNSMAENNNFIWRIPTADAKNGIIKREVVTLIDFFKLK